MKKKALYSFSYLILGSIILISIALGIVFISIYFLTNKAVFFIVSIVVLILGLCLFTALSIYFNKKMKIIYEDGIRKISVENFSKLAKGDFDLISYPESLENEKINKYIENIKLTNKSYSLINISEDFDKLNFQYLDDGLIDLDDFKNKLNHVINLSISYQNVLIEFYFDEEVEKETTLLLIKTAKETFKNYQRPLFISDKNYSSLFCYLANVDSFTKIYEEIGDLMKLNTYVKKDNITSKFKTISCSLVAYPYSQINELFSDLRYAKRQGQAINFYLPNRAKQINNTVFISQAMYHNFTNKALKELDNLNFDYVNFEHDKKIISDVFKNFMNYLHISHSGIVVLDENKNQYEFYLKLDNNETKLFSSLDIFDAEDVRLLKEICDSDLSYYFSSRNKANREIKPLIDRFNINAGYFKFILDNSKIRAFIYLFNDQNDLHLNTYIREVLCNFSLRIASLFIREDLDKKVDEYISRYNSILKLSEYYFYNIDNEMNIIEYSPNMTSLFSKIKKGMKCYKILYEQDHRCKHCPLKNFRKNNIEINKQHYEVSLTLNSEKSNERKILLHHVSDSLFDTNRYDNNLLINSYYSLVDYLKSLYYVNARGYLLILHLDNLSTMIEKQGSEGSLFVLRCFVEKIKQKIKTDNIFSYDSSTIALVLPEIGHVDILGICEKIYLISKTHFFDDGSDNDILNITYVLLAFPNNTPSAEDFLKNVIRQFNNAKYERNKDFVYFLDLGYERSASKRAFLIDVLDRTFLEKKYSFHYQPYVDSRSRKIYGAELLLRIPDTFQGTMLNAFELSKVASEENKVNLITTALLDTVNELNEQYAQTIFKNNNLKRLSLNIDAPFLASDDFIFQVTTIYKKYRFSNGFIGLEIGEQDISTNLKIVEKAASLANKHNIDLICDRYTGRYLNIEKLLELGFKEIKIERRLVTNIENDAKKLKELTSLLLLAKEKGINCTVVGVENEKEFNLIKDIWDCVFMQGYYLFKPLDKSEFITALKVTNK